jgi:hypothetical protein
MERLMRLGAGIPLSMLFDPPTNDTSERVSVEIHDATQVITQVIRKNKPYMFP